MSKRFNILATALAATFISGGANAAISLTDGALSYSQNFDTLTQSTSSTAWANDSTLAGWSLFTGAPRNNAIVNYYGGTGSSNGGAFYSFGNSSDRALGGLGSGGAYFGSPAAGSLAGRIGVAFQNNTGANLSGFTVGFDGEQWRNGGNTSAQSMVMGYTITSYFGTNWASDAPGAGFDWTSPVTAGTAGAIDGNVQGLVAGRGGKVAVTWHAGDTLFLYWAEKNDLGDDHGLAIDNFTLTGEAFPAPVPVPAALWLMGSGLGFLGWVGRRRKA